jgi:hypothetical protein
MREIEKRIKFWQRKPERRNGLDDVNVDEGIILK